MSITITCKYKVLHGVIIPLNCKYGTCIENSPFITYQSLETIILIPLAIFSLELYQ